MSNDISNAVLIPLLVSGCGISITAIAILIYHFLVIKFCRGRQTRLGADMILGFNNHDQIQAMQRNKLGLDKSALALIPSMDYTTQMFNDLVFRADQCECAICLADLEEGVTVRVLPNCRHSFHVKCIDQWLSSNLSCPVCRSQIFPFVFSEWIVEFEEVVEHRRGCVGRSGRRRCVPIYRCKNPPGLGSGSRENVPLEQPNNNNNNSNNVTPSTSNASSVDIICSSNNNDTNDDNLTTSSASSVDSISNSSNNDNLTSSTSSSSSVDIVCESEKYHIEIDVIDDDKNDNDNKENKNSDNDDEHDDDKISSCSSSPLSSFSSCSSSIGSRDVLLEHATSTSQSDDISSWFMRSLWQVQGRMGW